MSTKKTIVHLSDLHFREHWEEEQGLVLRGFFEDLAEQMKRLNSADVFVAFSGDLVQEGGLTELYKRFLEQFDAELIKLKIPRSQRICVPGNHDVDRKAIQARWVEHEGIVQQNLDERGFNDYLETPNCLLNEKFSNYLAFEPQFADYGITTGALAGAGWKISDGLGVYCLNTALCSSGGLNEIDDRERLAIGTRDIHKWILESQHSTRILIMHHPIESLPGWARKELETILRKHFSLCLSGHVHDQSIYHSVHNDTALIKCSAPPLMTSKAEKLGYSIISIGAEGVLDIQYRQWTRYHSFVSGVDFSDTDDGKVVVQRELDRDPVDPITQTLTDKLNQALCSYSSQPILWVEPVLSRTNEISKNADENSDNSVNLAELIAEPTSMVIQAPPQFGLTCLAHYVIKRAWTEHSTRWIYLNASLVKPNAAGKAIKKALKSVCLEIDDVACVVLDQWTNSEKHSLKLLNDLEKLFSSVPIIVMQTIDGTMFASQSICESRERKFDRLHLLALPRERIRRVVSAYNATHQIGHDDDTILTKVVADMTSLNIHRTPLNCLTLLKVSEKYFDESPVNRTKMLEMVLFILFNFDSIPTYKSRPDLKDCEYVLGRYCEEMLRTSKYYFSRDDFLNKLEQFCTEKLIDLEVDVVFDVLYQNSIIVKRDTQYAFRFSYWIFYFAAQRMHGDSSFAAYIFDQQKYLSYPELIEFYTGIDRSRADALKMLTDDLRKACDLVEAKVGLPDNMNPLKHAKWTPTDEEIGQMRTEVSENVLKSGLPDSVKDRHADKLYDQTKPYNQSVLDDVLRDYSFLVLFQNIRACARALRNSDYVQPEYKREALLQIMRSMDQLTKLVIAMAPVLATKRRVLIEGINITLNDDFSNDLERCNLEIIQVAPLNTITQFKDDLYSGKMGPLLFDYLENEDNELKKHALILLLILGRPRDWKKIVEKYVVSKAKDSWYLMDVVNVLRNEYQYSFVSPSVLAEIGYLIKMVFAKHELGSKKPGPHEIVKISNKALPKRKNREG